MVGWNWCVVRCVEMMMLFDDDIGDDDVLG